MADLTQNTILRFKCDESTGTTVYDSSGNNRHSLLLGGINRTSQNIYSFANEEGFTLSGSTRIPKRNNSNTLDVFGNQLTYKGKVSYPAQLVESNSISFDTIDDYAEFVNPYSFLRTTGFTTDFPVSIFARVLFKEINTTDVILAAGENLATAAIDFALYRDSGTNKIKLTIYSRYSPTGSGDRASNWQGNFTFALNTWYSILVTYDGNRNSTSAIFYINGALISNDLYASGGDGFYSGKTLALQNNWQISKIRASNFTSKDLSILSVYDSVLTAQEALDLSNNIFTKPAVVFFPFSEGTGNNTYTTSGSVITGATLFGGVTRSKQNIYSYNQLNNHYQYISGNTSGQTVILYSPRDLTNNISTGFTFSRFVQGSRYYLNGSESKVNFNYYNTPRTSLLSTGYTYNNILNNGNMGFRDELNKESEYILYNPAKPINNFSAPYILNSYLKNTNLKFEPEVITTINRMATKPNVQRMLTYDKLIKDIKLAQGLTLGVDNLSTIFKVFYIRASHNAVEGLKNWSSTSFDTTAVNNPIFTLDRGYKSDGVSSYLDWNFNPNTQSLTTNCNYGAYCITNLAANNSIIFGRVNSIGVSNGTIVNPRNASDLYRSTLMSATEINSVASTSSIGLYSLSKSATTQFNSWKDGILVDTSTTATSDNTNYGNMYELATRDSAIPGASGFTLREIAISYAATNSIDINMLGIYTAMRNYLLKIGIIGI